LDVQKAFEEITGREVEIRLVEKDQLEEFFTRFLSSNIASKFV
jgi:hypothetical protein